MKPVWARLQRVGGARRSGGGSGDGLREPLLLHRNRKHQGGMLKGIVKPLTSSLGSICARGPQTAAVNGKLGKSGWMNHFLFHVLSCQPKQRELGWKGNPQWAQLSGGEARWALASH